MVMEAANLHDKSPLSPEEIEPSQPEPEVRDTAAEVTNKQAEQATVSQQEHAQETDISDQVLLDRIKISDRWMILLTAVVAGTGLLGTIISFFQWNSMQGQLKEMQSNSAQTDNLLRQNSEQSKSLQDTSKTLDRTMRLAERAWLTVSFHGTIQFTVGKPIAFPTELINFGKTPARQVHLDAVVTLLPRGRKLQFVYSGVPHSRVRLGVVLPRWVSPIPRIPETLEVFRRVGNTERTEPIILTDQLAADLKAGKVLLIAHGKITYVDIFDVPHWGTACVVAPFVEPTAQDAWHSDCSAYNSHDKEY
jgi:hypothetical protein